MLIALTGASGFIGADAAHTLHQHGHEVVGLVRPTSARGPIEGAIKRFVVGDHADPEIWPDLLDQCDAIVHNSVDWASLEKSDLHSHLQSNLIGSICLLEAAYRANVKRFVFLSSVATHNEMLPRWGGQIDEEHPLRPGGLYGAYKAAVEAHLWSAKARWGMEIVALRPCAVYGVEPVNLERSHGYRLVKKLLNGECVTPKDKPGGGKFVHVEDVSLAILRSCEQAEAAGRAFHLADCYAKFTRFAEHARDILGLPESMVEPDTGPPAKNMFSKTASAEFLGVPLNRGDAGLRKHTGELIEAIRTREA